MTEAMSQAERMRLRKQLGHHVEMLDKARALREDAQKQCDRILEEVLNLRRALGE